MSNHPKAPYASKPSTATALPNASLGYQVRVSQRAKHVSLKVSHFGEVEVVVPVGFDQRQIPTILEKRQAWIANAIKQVEATRQAGLLQPTGAVPEVISFESVGAEWQVQYCETGGDRITIRTVPTSRQPRERSLGRSLIVSGQTSNHEACRQVLRQWLCHQAKLHLTPWLRRVSQEIDLPYSRVSIRGQKTLWASCSSKKSISLNYKLLFLPAPLVRYVLVHELCHTIHLNHSAQFWALVAEKQPDYQPLDKAVGRAWGYIPDWVDRHSP